MAEADWREILSFSQRELMQADKEKLCESLSWMEADDIELNFTDLKTLFRLAQDILKYKSEQVNNLLGQIETTQSKVTKLKSKESPTRGSDSPLETIAHQEEIIKANKEILEQLYADIAQLEGRKNKLEEDKSNADIDSESSRDALSEMNAVLQLENDAAMKNRHIRKLLGDIKVLEGENTKFKEKVSVLKDKLTEATQLIDHLTEQIILTNKECTQLKEMLGKSEQSKSQLSIEIEYLRKEMFEKESKRENIYEEIKTKVQHWKNIARAKKAEIKALVTENSILKEDLIEASRLTSSPKKTELRTEELKMKELQEKLSEASFEIEQSANLINLLKSENKQLKSIIEEVPDDTISVTKNESDDGKERVIINKLKTKVHNLTIALQNAEEMVAEREKELTEISSQIQLMQTNEGINALVDGLRSKKRQLKFKDEGIKSLVQEVNSLSQLVNDLQLENETLRQEFNISTNKNIPTTGIMKKYHEMEHSNTKIANELKDLENKLVNVEMENHNMKSKIAKMTKALGKFGYKDTVNNIGDSDDNLMPTDGGGESSTFLAKRAQKGNEDNIEEMNKETENKAIIEENEGLRRGLQEILLFLKDNSTTSSGVLTLQCPSLDTILQAMEARHSAGWFAPHMIAVMQLREALGGKDALITALHDARKETYDVMTQLSKETQRSSELEYKLNELESKNKQKESNEIRSDTTNITNICEFGSWISEKELINIEFIDKSEIDKIVVKGNNVYESKLKKGLEYFHNRFKTLFDKMTDMVMQATDDRNKWDIQEEQYKAEIENLKGQLHQIEDEDISDNSPGLTFIPSLSSLQRKCSYLEESYKYIRTLNENMKNENLECKKDTMIMSAEYETQIQKLILAVANLTDKLRNSIPIDLFWKQNLMLNEYISKYRKVVQDSVECNKRKPDGLVELLQKNKIDIISYFKKHFEQNISKLDVPNTKKLLSEVEQSILEKQVEQICCELEGTNKKIGDLEKNNMELQETQSRIIDQTLASISNGDVELMKDQLQNLTDENKILKEQCQHVGSQLDISLLQLQHHQHRQISSDMEINLLRHQILDLQSTDDNKAIVARLSGEVLVAHLQALDSHKKLERLNLALYKEKELRVQAEEMLKARQKIFEVYSVRYENKFRYMYEIMQILRQQYQESLPLASLENYLNKMEELNRNNQAVNEKLHAIEDLQSSLMIKHSVYDQILDITKNKCQIEEETCAHHLKYIVMQSIHSREIDHLNKKIKSQEQSQEELNKHCNNLEKSLVLLNRGFGTPILNDIKSKRNSDGEICVSNLELEDFQSDEESSTRRSQTITLPRPQVLKPPVKKTDPANERDYIVVPDPEPQCVPKSPKSASVSIQTTIPQIPKKSINIQTEDDKQLTELKMLLSTCEKNIRSKNNELSETIKSAQQCTKEFLALNIEKNNLECTINQLKESYEQQGAANERLQITIKELRKQLDEIKTLHAADISQIQELANDENKSLLLALKQHENDKNDILAEYKNLLNNEREEYANTMKTMHAKITELQTNIDKKENNFNVTNPDTTNETNKNTKTMELEDKCFKLQSELEDCKSEVATYQSESERWKSLASERLTKLEQLNSQLKERHFHEVESYKAENQHWLSQLSDTQREHMELRSRLTEQKALYVKQLADKDSQIEQLRSIVHNLKTQIMNMQTMISVNDPSFDLSAIVEVDEASDGLSQHGSDRLELKFDSTGDLHDMHDDIVRMPSSSSAIWQEPIIERLRREKQITSKQNIILRRQIKALAARERRSRLDAQNLKNQVFRINTSSTKVTTAETAAFQHKIASLQAQLTSARRDTHSSIALWDKWKRAQQTAERWQARYSEKCQEATKLESGLNLAKSALSRLEKEKRVLLSRLTEVKHESQLAIEKQETESLEKSHHSSRECVCAKSPPPPVSSRALLERVQAQQRRIAALEVAEKGNEFLVSEYEKSLAEITSLKGQVLKLESTLLESQIKTPLKTNNDTQPELEYWKSYCDMLKDENVQLTLKVNSLETTPSTGSHHRINDLEQTVLTLRGLVSKLQADQKSSGVNKKVDSRPSSGRSSTDKGRNQESHRVEMANLKRSIQEKDLLLERSKEMLKIAAEREDELLRENEFLRRRLDEMTQQHEGFLSV